MKEKQLERKELREGMKGIQDIERLTSRIFLGQANARDLVGLKKSLQSLALLQEDPRAFQRSALEGNPRGDRGF